MSAPENNPRISPFPRCDVDVHVRDFLIDRQARGLSPRTVDWYREKLGLLRAYLRDHHITSVEDVTAPLVRAYLVHLGETHNPGGVHAAFRALRAFLNWWEAEVEPPGWSHPLRKVKAPRLSQEPLDPVPLEDLRAMLATCARKTFTGERDRALMMFLLDSGCRRGEFCALNVGDVNLATGGVHIARGKGNKPRMTFVGAKTRRALTVYLRVRANASDDAPLWATQEGTRLGYAGLREVLRRRSKQAGVPEPSLHAFRRGFAIAALRGGCDLITLQRLLGHSSLAVISRYLKQVEGDLQSAHAQVAPVDRLI